MSSQGSPPKTIEQITADLRKAVKHIQYAVEEVDKLGKEAATVKLGILSVNPDGSGQIKCQFECKAFLDDLCLILGLETLTDEERADHERIAFFHRVLKV